MRFRIRFAEQIVGLFIIIALASIVLVIVLLSISQRWFNEDGKYYTELETANGISVNMSVQYRGFTIGHVTDVKLEGEVVKVSFSIHEDHKHRVKHGSIMQLEAGPLGALLGNQFIFIPGRGSELVPDGRDGKEAGFVPLYGTRQATAHIDGGLAQKPDVDSINQIIDGAVEIVDVAKEILSELQKALKESDDTTDMGRIVGGITRTVEMLPDMVTTTVDDLMEMLEGVMVTVRPIMNNIEAISSMMAEPDGAVASLLEPDGEIHASLTNSIRSISGTLDSFDQALAFIPPRMPQLIDMLTELQITLETANEVLISLTQHPLLKGGIPPRMDIHAVGTSPRDIRF